MKSWRAAFEVYRDRRMLAILFMGFGSGLPLALTGSTLAIWMKEEGLSLTAIGLFSLVGLSYSLKFLWSPLLDCEIPALRRLGRRRGWALLIQAALALAILALGAADPAADLWLFSALAALVAFLSASQDIVIDAFRVDMLDPDAQGAGAASTQVGYRIGMIASTAGVLYLATFFGWFAAYAVMALSVLIAMAAVLMTPEPRVPPRPAEPNWLKAHVVAPLRDFFDRQSSPTTWRAPRSALGAVLLWCWARRRAFALLAFVVLFKLGDALAGHMTGAFYLELGFTKIEIANITKVFGVIASMAGIAAGGVVVYRLGVTRALLVCGVVQMASNLLYIVQAKAGHDPLVLIFTIGLENFAGGMGSAAFVAYLSGLCAAAFTATQYALLSALASVARVVLSSSGGSLAETFGWVNFFLIATACAIPALLLLLWLMRRDVAPETGAAAPAE